MNSRGAHLSDGALALLLLGLALAIYFGTAALTVRITQSPSLAYFDHAAAGFLRGQLYLAAPPSTYDLTWHAGQWYLPFPPLPALLLVPSAALFGIAGTNTVLFTAAAGALNVALTFLIVRALTRRSWSRLDWAGAVWLAVMLGWGSVHWSVAVQGNVWFTSQVITLTFLMLATWAALAVPGMRVAAVAAGAALGAAVLGRPHVALSGALVLGILLQRLDADDRGGLKPAAVVGVTALTLVPVVLAAGMLLAYNQARFGDWLDFGYARQNVAKNLLYELHSYGQFSLRYWPANIRAMVLALPVRAPGGGLPVPDIQGMSVLITTPALVYLARAVAPWPRRLVMAGAWASLLATVAVLLSYYNTGATQFGYRFSLDFMPAVVVLLACALRRVSRGMRALIVAGVLVNAYGVVWFAQYAVA